jgi:hypothetical protein
MADGAGMEERVAALVLVNDELKYRLDAQADSAKGIETKAVILVGFAATAVQFVISHNHKPVWAVLAAAAYAIAFGAGLWAIRLRHFKAVPEPAFLGAKYEAALDANTVAIREYLLVSLIGTRIDTFAKNDAKVVTKVIAIRAGSSNSIALTSEWGTSRANAIRLVEANANQRLVTVTDETPDGQRMTNLAETLSAREKQEAITERFSSWVWEDPGRQHAQGLRRRT